MPRSLLTVGRLVIAGLQALVALGLIILLVGNLRLYVPIPPPPSTQRVPAEVWAELRYLWQAIDQGAGADMQRLFPEGDFFLHVLYGLSWVNVGLETEPDGPQREQALAQARWAWAELGAPHGLAPFTRSRTLSPEYGVFYTGWRNTLLAGILLLQEPAELDSGELEIFQAECDRIAEAMATHPTPFLPAYPGACWPVDTFPAVTSLRAHAHLVDDRYTPAVDAWLAALPAYRDPTTGLLPHRVDCWTGAQIQGARATSQVLMLRFLYDLDPGLGQEQYRIFRQGYAVYLWGLPGVLEYPTGTKGAGDVDSGPLVEGVSLSATALMLGTGRIYGDVRFSNAIWHAGEVLGFPVRYAGTKRYWFGQLPVGDGFAVWSKTARPWFQPVSTATYPPIVPWWWRLPFHAASLGLGGGGVLCIEKLRRLRRWARQMHPAHTADLADGA